MGMGTGWVQGGVIPGTPPAARGGNPDRRSRAPEALQGLEWVVRVDGRTGGAVQAPTMRARSVSLQEPSLVPAPLTAASWPIRARIDPISCKVSQNGQVSPKNMQKASRSPYSQNGLKKSPLEFLGFPLFVAFSHKELMVPFWRCDHI